MTFDGRGGDDYISGGMGNDILRGGSGTDTVSYEYASSAVYVDLTAGLAMGGGGKDTLSDFEAVVGSPYADTLLGNAGRNTLSGGAGNDTIITVTGLAAVAPGGGFDRVDGGSGNDLLRLGGAQSDYHVLSSGDRTFLVSARGATEVTGVEQAAFNMSPTQSWSNVLSSTAAFDGLSYIASHSDLRAAFGTNAASGVQHFLVAGFTEGRAVTFNALDYIASNSDLITAFGADATRGAQHFIIAGASEGRTVTFNGWEYLASYSDLIQALGSDATRATQHFIGWGVNEGRSVTFNAQAYAAANADLAAAFGNDAEALARHYVMYGFAEGRSLGIGGPASAAIAPAAAHIDATTHDTVPAAAFVVDGDHAIVAQVLGANAMLDDYLTSAMHVIV